MQPEDEKHLLQVLNTMLVQINELQSVVCTEQSPAPQDMQTLKQGLATLEQLTHGAVLLLGTAGDELPLAELNGQSLTQALTQAVEETAETLGLSSRIQFSGEEQSLSASSERLLYLIAREALYQIEQHSGARKLRFAFTFGRTEAQMNIEDDGIIPDEPQPLPGDEPLAPPFTDIALQRQTTPLFTKLQQRIEQLGGSVEIQAEPGKGTRLQVRLPVGTDLSRPQADVLRPDVSLPSTDASHPIIPLTPITSRVRILLVDGQAVSRAGLQRLLESYSDLQVAGTAADGVQAVSETLELGPQLVLMDMQLPKGQSLEALRQIKQLNLDTRVLLLSSQEREDALYEALRIGADGFVLKDIAPDELAEAIRAVARGEVLVRATTRRTGTTGLERHQGIPLDELTTREQDVLRLLSRGLRNKEIAARLVVSERTVNFHLANIYQKLNVSGRTEALSKALEYGLITA